MKDLEKDLEKDLLKRIKRLFNVIFKCTFGNHDYRFVGVDNNMSTDFYNKIFICNNCSSIKEEVVK